MENETNLDMFEAHLIRTFEHNVKNNILLGTNPDLMGRKPQDLYNDYIDKTTKKNFNNYLMSSFNDYDYDYIYNVCLEVVNEIFNNKEITEIFKITYPYIEESFSEEIFDGLTSEISNNDNGEILRYVAVPSKKNITSITCILHEFTHLISFIHKIDLNKKKYYHEIIPICIELIANKYIAKIEDENTSNKIESSRLDVINWHYVTHPQEVKELLKLLKNAKTPLQKKLIEETYKACPYLKKEHQDYYLTYNKFMAESYGIGYLYAKYLSNRYEDDPKKISEEIQNVILGNKSMDDMLKYFGMTLRNSTIYKEVNDDISELRKSL